MSLSINEELKTQENSSKLGTAVTLQVETLKGRRGECKENDKNARERTGKVNSWKPLNVGRRERFVNSLQGRVGRPWQSVGWDDRTPL